MSFYKRPNGRWAVQIYDPATRRPRQIGTYATRKEAKAAEQVAQSAAASGLTVAEWAARWLDDYPRKKGSTTATHRERVDPFAQQFGSRRMDSITVQEARGWALANRTKLPGVRAMFNDARRSGHVQANPFSALGIEQSRGRRDLPSGWLTAADVDVLCTIAEKAHGDTYGPMVSSMVRFAAYTGIRPGELYALEHGDLGSGSIEIARAADSKTRKVTTPKNGRARVIVYPEQARKAVEAAPRLDGVSRVFSTPRGRQFWASSFSWIWAPIRVAFGRPDMDFYELRHFCATYLLELGVSHADVAVQLGHTDGGALVMSTYGHPSDVAARARIKAAMDGHDSGEIASLKERRSA